MILTNQSLTLHHGLFQNCIKTRFICLNFLFVVVTIFSDYYNNVFLRQIDALINALNVPKGFYSHFQVKNVFLHTKHLRGVSKIHVCTILMPLIMHIALAEMPIEYCLFFILLSNDLLDLMRPCFRDDEEVEQIYLRFVEIVCLHEGLFPLYESLFQWRQLIDLPRNIKIFL
jgi:hypothetical protein